MRTRATHTHTLVAAAASFCAALALPTEALADGAEPAPPVTVPPAGAPPAAASVDDGSMTRAPSTASATGSTAEAPAPSNGGSQAGESAPASASTAARGARAHGADGPAREPRGETWDTWGEARGRGLKASQVIVDGSGRALDPGHWHMTRLIAGARYQPSRRVKLELELEGLSGFVAGDTTALGTALSPRPFPVARDGRGDLGRVLPRKASATVTTDIGQFSAGAQTFTWGTGMLANDGAGDPTFGDPWLGNVVGRVAFATRPAQGVGSPLIGSLAVFVAADYVLRDDNASIYDGDRAYAGLVGVRAQHEGDAFGALLVARRQRDRDDPLRPDGARAETTVAVVDVHARTTWRAGETRRFAIEAEGAAVLGESTRPWSDATFRDGASVRQMGGVGRARWEDDGARLTAQLEGGYASGDNDPRDAVARTFTMHTDHNVGLVLFEHLLPMITARGVDRLADPGLVAVAPPGTRFAINPGAVQNAVYAHPTARWRPVEPLELRLGYVFAAPAADLIDAYQTGTRAGFATSYGGKVQHRGAYGHEVDARVTWQFSLPEQVRLRVGGEGGVLAPGAAFDGVPGVDEGGGARRKIWVGRAMLSVLW